MNDHVQAATIGQAGIHHRDRLVQSASQRSQNTAHDTQRIAVVVNVPTSSMAREADLLLPTHAGPEIGVASTKAFTTQLVGLFLLALTLAKLRGALAAEEKHVKALRHLPSALGAVVFLLIAWPVETVLVKRRVTCKRWKVVKSRTPMTGCT